MFIEVDSFENGKITINSDLVRFFYKNKDDSRYTSVFTIGDQGFPLEVAMPLPEFSLYWEEKLKNKDSPE